MRLVACAYLPNEYIQGWGRSVGRTGPANIYKGVGLVGWKQKLHAGKMLKRVQHDSTLVVYSLGALPKIRSLGLFGVSENSSFTDTFRAGLASLARRPSENPLLGLFGVSENSPFTDTLRAGLASLARRPTENPLFSTA